MACHVRMSFLCLKTEHFTTHHGPTFPHLSFLQCKYQEKALQVLRKAKVVAMTTTGAAIHQQLLNKLEAPIIFVEEAAEILETNLLASLTPHVKHLILIGDHKQLKPTVRLYNNKAIKPI